MNEKEIIKWLKKNKGKLSISELAAIAANLQQIALLREVISDNYDEIEKIIRGKDE